MTVAKLSSNGPMNVASDSNLLPRGLIVDAELPRVR